MVSGVCTFTDDAFDGCVLGPNYSGFYAEVDFAVTKNLQELEEGILQGPFPGPAFMPCRVFATNVAIQPNGKKRRTGDGGWPRDFEYDGQDVSLNNAIDIDDESKFPLYTLPSAVTFGRLLSIAASCEEFSGDGRMQMNVLLSDWVAYYRTFVLDVRYFWTQLNIFMPAGATVDTAMYFGDKGAPCVSNHAMNWLLFMWQRIFFDMIKTRTSWDVSKQCAVASIDPWDDHPKVRQWRQARYQTAREQGLSDDDAFSQSVPFVIQGYFDDGQAGVPRTLMPQLVTALFTLVNLVGVAVEYSKLTWAKPDGTVGHCQPRTDDPPQSFTDVDFTFVPGDPLILGKEVCLAEDVIRECQTRRDDVILSLAEVSLSGYVWTSRMQSLIGQLMYIVITIPALRGCLNSPMRCLKADTQLHSVQQRSPPGR